MEKRKKASVTFSAVALALIVSIGVGLFMQRSGLTPSYLVFAGDSTPDSYGNMVRQVWMIQAAQGKSWDIDYGEYTEGMTVEIDANYQTQIIVAVNINKTLANDPGEAAAYTRVYLNVSTVFTDQLLTYWQVQDLDAGFYTVTYNSTLWTPSADTVYACTVEFEAYY